MENAETTFLQSLVRKVKGQPYENAKCFRCGEDAAGTAGKRFEGIFGRPSCPTRLRDHRIGCCDKCSVDDEFADEEKMIRFKDGTTFETSTEPTERVNAD